MTDRRPDCVYGILIREGRVFLRSMDGRFGLPGGIFRPLAEDRKVELRAHLWDQLGLEARAVWAQGAFEYRNPDEETEKFSGFYTVWEWEPDPAPAPALGRWFDSSQVAASTLVPSLKILLQSVIATQAVKTT